MPQGETFGKAVELLKKAQAGDERAFEELVRLTVDYVRQTAYFYTKKYRLRETTADEAVLEAYRRFGSNYQSIRDPTKIFRWLAVTIGHVFQTFSRMPDERISTEDIENIATLTAPIDSNPFYCTCQREFANEVKAAFEIASRKLTRDEREVIYLFFFADLSIAEIATILGKTPGQISNFKLQAREKLKRHNELRKLYHERDIS
jgi:RNA polymerase sigma factor (sigma-70 family)